ncbi:hypothetical protein TNCV_792801 [Trichonephila clavipes]|nr:hypothetical protein TNCV_792801 [Trichonephila clavipes]
MTSHEFSLLADELVGSFTGQKCLVMTDMTNRKAPFAVRTLEVLSPRHSDSTPPGTEAIQLRQQPIMALPLATQEGNKNISNLSTNTMPRIPATPLVGQDVEEPYIMKLFPNTKFVVIQNATHTVYNDCPLEFTEAVLQFLQE